MKEVRRGAKSKDALKKALLELLKEKDLDHITITDLVHRANLNRGTFYYHYQSIAELFDELVHDVCQDFIEAYKAPYLQTERFMVSNLNSHSVNIFKHVLTYFEFYSTVICSPKLAAYETKIIQLLRNLIRRDYHFVMNKNKKVDIELLATYNAYALFGLITEWVKTGYQHSPEYMAEQLIEILSGNVNSVVVDTTKMTQSSDFVH